MFMRVIPSYIVSFDASNIGVFNSDEAKKTISLRVSGKDGVTNLIDILSFNNIEDFEVKKEDWPNR